MLTLGLSLNKSKHTKNASPYQQWPGYPQSPVLTADYPNQIVGLDGAYDMLFASTGKYYVGSTLIKCNATWYVWRRTAGVGSWTSLGSVGPGTALLDSLSNIIKANTDIYTNSSLTTVAFPKNV